MDDYRSKVYKWIESLDFEQIVINDVAKKKTIAIFVDTIKQFIDEDCSNEYYIEFNNDFTKLRKCRKAIGRRIISNRDQEIYPDV